MPKKLDDKIKVDKRVKKVKPIPKKNEIYLTYEEDRKGGLPLSDEPWSDREDEEIEFSVKEVFASIDNLNWVETIEVDFNPVDFIDKDIFVIVVRYSTGDTFGQTSGSWYVEGAYTTIEKTDKIVKSINDDKYKGYKPWSGYFERFSHVEIHKMILRNNSEYRLVNVKYFNHK